jgi:hypothetical protein
LAHKAYCPVCGIVHEKTACPSQQIVAGEPPYGYPDSSPIKESVKELTLAIRELALQIELLREELKRFMKEPGKNSTDWKVDKD